MYIKRIVDCNLGPISKIDIKPKFDDAGNPKPLIVVGKNGSGKSIFLSNIVDSFYEFAGKCFMNACHIDNSGMGHVFYKMIGGLQIKIGNNYLFSHIVFDNKVEYFFKAGVCSHDKFKEESGYSGVVNGWIENENLKQIQGLSNKEIEKLFAEQIFCYFGPERYEKPNWMGEAYYDDLKTHLDVKPKYNGRLQNEITAYNMGKDNFRWLLDVIVDSRTDIEIKGEKFISVHVDKQRLKAMSQARTNVERVMSAILGEDVYFGLNLRQAGEARFNIKREKDNSIVSPTMDSLSTGQLALFNIFSTIIRYADSNDINKSIHLNQIKGIVVIDEIEMHLHSTHQKEILPKLIKLFPGVQFIVTTHSPLFLLGMKESYGENGFDIYQMPDGTKIDAERFQEFKIAYDYFAETELHHAKIREAIDQTEIGKPLVITEGATDWKHLLAAYNVLSKKDEYKDVFDGLLFDFFEYEPANSSKEAKNKIDMGNTTLVTMCESYSRMPQKRKMIFIADCDDKKTNEKIGIKGKPYKKWGNNVFSFLLPVPDSRRDTPEICIEHLYSDEEIKTNFLVNGIQRRLYMGNEFNEKGISQKLKKMCERKNICGPAKITIIEGSSGEKVTDIFDDYTTNYALSKMEFAECVLEKRSGFEKFDFTNFIGIFKILRDIILSDNEGK